MAIELFSLYTNLKDSFDVHLNDLYTDFDIIMIAELLDTRTYNLVNTSGYLAAYWILDRILPASGDICRFLFPNNLNFSTFKISKIV